MASTVRLVHVFARIAPLGHFLNSPTILAVIVQMASGAALARLSALSASLVAFGRTSQVALVVHQALAAVRQQLNVMSAQQDGSAEGQLPVVIFVLLDSSVMLVLVLAFRVLLEASVKLSRKSAAFARLAPRVRPKLLVVQRARWER